MGKQITHKGRVYMIGTIKGIALTKADYVNAKTRYMIIKQSLEEARRKKRARRRK